MPSLTAKFLQDVLRNGVKGSHKRPSKSAEEILLKQLTSLAFLFRSKESSQRSSELQEQFLAPMLILRAILPHVRRSIARALLRSAELQSDLLETLDRDNCRLEVLELAVRDLLDNPPTLVTPIAFNGWHDIAEVLAECFRAAMRSTNPALEIKISNDGPVVRFIASVVPAITGDRHAGCRRHPNLDGRSRPLDGRRRW